MSIAIFKEFTMEQNMSKKYEEMLDREIQKKMKTMDKAHRENIQAILDFINAPNVEFPQFKYTEREELDYEKRLKNRRDE